MKHTHPVFDSDKHFTIDPVTRAISNVESKKNMLMQNDHNSERFSFEIDRFVEGHDLTLCNRIDIHYANADAADRSKVNAGVYNVADMKVCEDDDNKLVFTWLVSENATMYAGTLTFLIMFACIENGVSVYRWNTAPNSSISIARGMYNGDEIVETYPDVFTQMREELFAAVYGYKDMSIGVNPPSSAPYIWFDTSKYTTEETQGMGVITVKDIAGNVHTLYPITKVESVKGLQEKLDSMSTLKATYDAASETVIIG